MVMDRPSCFTPVVSSPSFFFFLFSFFLADSQRSHSRCLPYFHTWCNLSANLKCMTKCAACGSLKYRTQKLRKKSPSADHRTNLSGYAVATKACIDNRKKNLLNNNISSICPYNTLNFGPLTAEIGWRVWGTRANFNGFTVFASLLHRRRTTEVN